MRTSYRSAMEALYLACMVVAGVSMVVMTLSIPYAVFMRYVLNDAPSWPEPLAILMMVNFTFIGAAACYRAGIHIAVTMFVDAMPAILQRSAQWIVILLLTLVSIFMVFWGVRLAMATWNQFIAEFTFLRVGITYLPIPLGGVITLLFILEQVWLGPPEKNSFVHHEPAA